MKTLLGLLLLFSTNLKAQSPLSEEFIDPYVENYGQRSPQFWGSNQVPGVLTKLNLANPNEQVIALTFDACGGGDGYDKELIDFLIDNNVPATLFINSRWVAKFPKAFEIISNNPLFQIENHGTEHRPLSVNGKSQYKIRGTRSVAEVVREVEENARNLRHLTGEKITYFRAGTAYYDEVAVEIVNDLGYHVAGYSLLGDAGASFSASKVKSQLLKAVPGDVALLHMNRPKSGTREGVKMAIPLLRDKGFKFVLLNDYGMTK